MSTARSLDPHGLPSSELARRLAELAGEERQTQVEFLLHLAVFDERRDWAEAGYGSLWTYCLEVLRLREGAAWRRIEAMKLLRRFPCVEPALRDGRLCLTTLSLLGPLLTEDTVAEVVARAAFLSKADTLRLVASIRPQVAPTDGIRRMAAPRVAAPVEATPAAGAPTAAPELAAAPALTLVYPSPPAPRHELRPVSADAYSLRVTLDAEAKAELDQLVSLLAHKTKGNLADVLREAVRCAIEKHGKRKGAMAPERKRRSTPASDAEAGQAPRPTTTFDPRAVPIELKRQVWARDGGRCAWVSPEGKRCGSTWMLELGHITPAALGGTPTLGDLRIECRAHNQLEAVRFFGAEHMARYLGKFATGRPAVPERVKVLPPAGVTMSTIGQGAPIGAAPRGPDAARAAAFSR
jgi:hypothetical protein